VWPDSTSMWRGRSSIWRGLIEAACARIVILFAEIDFDSAVFLRTGRLAGRLLISHAVRRRVVRCLQHETGLTHHFFTHLEMGLQYDNASDRF
jgi:hypothetical protein